MKRSILALFLFGALLLGAGCGQVEDGFGEVHRDSQQRSAIIRLDLVKSEMSYYFLQQGVLVTELQPLVKAGRLEPKDLVDPWGHVVRLTLGPERQRILCSAGPDGVFDSPDDVCVTKKHAKDFGT